MAAAVAPPTSRLVATNSLPSLDARIKLRKPLVAEGIRAPAIGQIPPLAHTMTALDVAARLVCSLATAKRYCAAWEVMQHRDPLVPRVTRPPTGRRGRRGFCIDRDSFDRWLYLSLDAQAA